MFPDRRTRSFLDPAALSRLAAVPLFARRAMQGSVSGRHPSPHRGSSVEFAEYRKYVPGDDLRRLDWRAFGRSDRYFVKEFEADTNLRCCLVVDTSGSMDYGSAGTTKIEYARRIAAALGHLALQQGDAVGLSCVADGVVRNIPPRRNPAHLMAIFDALEAARPEGRDPPRADPPRAGRDDPPAGPDRDPVRPLRRARAPPRVLRAPPVPQARRRRLPPARPPGDRLRLPAADPVPRHGRRPVDLRRAERDRRPLPEGPDRLPRRAPAGRPGVGRRLPPGRRSTRTTRRS